MGPWDQEAECGLCLVCDEKPTLGLTSGRVLEEAAALQLDIWGREDLSILADFVSGLPGLQPDTSVAW